MNPKPRYEARRIIDANWGVKDTVTDEYVTAWRERHACIAIAAKLNAEAGQDDYRDVYGMDDPDELGPLFDDMARA